jgi:hypothetical protein
MKRMKVLTMVTGFWMSGFAVADDDYSLMGSFAGNVNCELGVQVASTAKAFSYSDVNLAPDSALSDVSTSCHLLVSVAYRSYSKSIELYYRLGNAPDLPARFSALVPTVTLIYADRTRLEIKGQQTDNLDMSFNIYENSRRAEDEIVAKRFVSIFRNESGEKIMKIYASKSDLGISVDLKEIETNGPVPESAP